MQSCSMCIYIFIYAHAIQRDYEVMYTSVDAPVSSSACLACVHTVADSVLRLSQRSLHSSGPRRSSHWIAPYG